jgi:iron complex outermembrane receptor protein
MNFSMGAVIQAGDLSLTIDAYRINIDNRIVLSENLTATNVRDFLTSKGFIGIGGGRFFINGVDTNTRGVDIVANYPVRFDNGSKIDVTATANFNSTEVTRLPTISQIAQLNPTLFGRVNVLTFEEGNPKNKFVLSGAWSHGSWGATLRATRYGDVLSPGTTASADFVLTAKTLVDLEARYEVNESVKVAFGADNILDKYPDGLPPSLNTTGATSFSNYSPFGRSGRFIYGRVTVGF